MRKLPVVLSVISLALVSSTFVPAEAASQYRVSVSVSPRALDVAPNHSERAKISGRVTGGSVAGKKVRLYATNTSSSSRTRSSIGTVTLSSSGTFSRSYRPANGGTYKIEAVIATSGSTKGATKAAYLTALEWAYLYEFYHRGADNKPADDWSDLITGVNKDRDEKIAGAKDGHPEGYFTIESGGTAVFDLRGYKCEKLTYELGISNRTSDGESYRGRVNITQGDKTLLSTRYMKRGQDAYIPGKSTRDKLVPTRKVEVAALSYPAKARFVLANAKAFCAFPSVNH